MEFNKWQLQATVIHFLILISIGHIRCESTKYLNGDIISSGESNYLDNNQRSYEDIRGPHPSRRFFDQDDRREMERYNDDRIQTSEKSLQDYECYAVREELEARSKISRGYDNRQETVCEINKQVKNNQQNREEKLDESQALEDRRNNKEKREVSRRFDDRRETIRHHDTRNENREINRRLEDREEITRQNNDHYKEQRENERNSEKREERLEESRHYSVRNGTAVRTENERTIENQEEQLIESQALEDRKDNKERRKVSRRFDDRRETIRQHEERNEDREINRRREDRQETTSPNYVRIKERRENERNSEKREERLEESRRYSVRDGTAVRTENERTTENREEQLNESQVLEDRKEKKERREVSRRFDDSRETIRQHEERNESREINRRCEDRQETTLHNYDRIKERRENERNNEKLEERLQGSRHYSVRDGTDVRTENERTNENREEQLNGSQALEDRKDNKERWEVSRRFDDRPETIRHHDKRNENREISRRFDNGRREVQTENERITENREQLLEVSLDLGHRKYTKERREVRRIDDAEGEERGEQRKTSRRIADRREPTRYRYEPIFDLEERREDNRRIEMNRNMNHSADRNDKIDYSNGRKERLEVDIYRERNSDRKNESYKRVDERRLKVVSQITNSDKRREAIELKKPAFTLDIGHREEGHNEIRQAEDRNTYDEHERLQNNYRNALEYDFIRVDHHQSEVVGGVPMSETITMWNRKASKMQADQLSKPKMDIKHCYILFLQGAILGFAIIKALKTSEFELKKGHFCKSLHQLGA